MFFLVEAHDVHKRMAAIEKMKKYFGILISLIIGG
jgi:hypothetical protein